MADERTPGDPYPRDQPVSLDEWMRILHKAGEEREPPLDYLVARDARAALLRGDLRRAAIDMGTVAEITLNNAYKQNVASHHGRRPDAEPGDLRTLVEVLSDAGVPLGTAQEDIGQLANVRNVAVHERREMTDDELRPYRASRP